MSKVVSFINGFCIGFTCFGPSAIQDTLKFKKPIYPIGPAIITGTMYAIFNLNN